jgi:AcrR family transcriptional regulator
MKKNMSKTDSMTISVLSRLSGVPTSTIRYYLREGLIPQPLRKGKTRAYYSKEHVIQLKKLKKLRTKTKLPIEEIKRIHGVFTNTPDIVSATIPMADRKDDIITAATELFRTKGYDNTSMDDIAELAKISKATFYKHFTDKENLFFECADRVFYDIDKDFKELYTETDIIKRFKLRAALFIKTHRYMIDMLNVARGTYATASKQYKLKLDSIIINLTTPLQHDLDEGVKQGIFKKMNTEVVAHMLMGAAEYIIYFLNGKNEAEIDSFIEENVNLLFRGADPNKNRPR